MAKVGGGRSTAARGKPALGVSAAASHSAPSAMRIRIDKWLWHARFFKSRSLAAELAESGHCRVNGQPISRASREVGPGDVLTFPQGRMIRLIRILETGVRRGPASEAQLLFIDLDASSNGGECLE